MASIFNLFGDFSNSANASSAEQTKSLTRPSSTTSIARSPLKAGPSNAKPKGLSIRSNSDLNVSTLNSRLTNNNQGLKQDYLKPKSNTFQSLSTSPKNKDTFSKKQIIQSTKVKKLSKVFQNIQPDKSEKQTEEAIFKRPQTPRKILRKSEYPMPEYLAPYCDMDYEFNDICSIKLENDLKKLGINIKNSIIQPYKDEGFESEPEELPLPSVPRICVFDGHFDDKFKMDLSVDLPDISDTDSDF